jgi:DegV family protein with EDD domain
MSIRVVTDSGCDLPASLIAAHRIGVVPLQVNVGSESLLDGIELTRADFYESLPHYESFPTTSVPSPGQFRDVYNALAADGAAEILSIHIANSLSAVANSARLGAERAAVPVHVLDSGQLTLGTGLLVLAAAQAAAQGMSMEDIVSLVETKAARTYSFAALDTVEFLRRSGRLSRFQSSLASVLRIKPLLKLHRGEMGMERVRTRRRAVERLMELVAELGPLERLALVHTHAVERVEKLRQQASHLSPCASEVLVAEITPVIGAHVGPGGRVCGHCGRERTWPLGLCHGQKGVH